MALGRALIVVTAVALLLGGAVVWSGMIDPAADAPHARPVLWMLDQVRRRGVAVRGTGIDVPDLADDALVRSGAGNYAAMCAGCHLAPGVTDGELYRGLYPQPPALAAPPRPIPPGEAFWVIKHGIKASGMPAWGRSMDERSIWGLVAFLQRLPGLTEAGYAAVVQESDGHVHEGMPGSDMTPAAHDGEDDHDHDHGHAATEHDH